ncbi:MAG TPA: conjugative transfer system coupling protein TraD [Burkholderiaceae bacterium]|nr:conjugative transfer system coupling protein TraD [Burkholderiaceae bacterium]
MLRRYEQPWRPAYEGIAAVAWFLGAAFFLWQAFRSAHAVNLMFGLSVACMVMCLLRAKKALTILVLRASLSGRAMETMTHSQLRRITKQGSHVFFGYGFEWMPKHSQRLYDLQRINFRGILAPSWLMRLKGMKVVPQPDGEIGLPYIHGVEPNEVPIMRPITNLEGGTRVDGTTGSGKGVVISHLACQAVYRGDVVMILDPKNSMRLKENVRYACQQARAPDTFLEFHPAFPETGIRLDPTYNFQKVTELASRIKALMPPSKEGSFENFAWDAVNVVCQACVHLEDRPNLLKIKQYIEGGIEPLLAASLERHFSQYAPREWRDRIRGTKMPRGAKFGPHVTDELFAMVQYYDGEISKINRSQVIDSQIRVFKHPREHYQRIVASLLPILNSLTSGDLGRSLAPDPFDPNDRRPIFNLEKIIKGRHVLYFSLDSLPDAQVASAMGGLLCADLSAYLGMRYNLGISAPRISLFIDEVSNVINTAAIEIMNKGREAGCQVTVAMQTFADLVNRLGSEHAARMALGNLNNTISLRARDRETQKYITETFGELPIQSMELGVTAHTDEHLPDFAAGYSRRVSETHLERVPAQALMELPDLQYFASLSGGRLYKGRVPILLPDPVPASKPRLAPRLATQSAT